MLIWTCWERVWMLLEHKSQVIKANQLPKEEKAAAEGRRTRNKRTLTESARSQPGQTRIGKRKEIH